MDLRKELLKEHSKKNTESIVNYLIANPKHVSQLFELFFGDETLLKQRSAWVIGDLGRAKPNLVVPFHKRMLQHLQTPDLHDAVKRNTIRYMSEIKIEVDLWGEAYDLAMKYLADINTTVAVKCFSMTLALNIVKELPELKEELKFIIEEQMPYGTAGFKSRGKKTLLAIEKLN